MGGGWVYPEEANNVTVSGLGIVKALVGTWWAISLLLSRIGFVFSPCRASRVVGFKTDLEVH